MPVMPAPAEMPIICGSARGLRMTACKIAPATARFDPTMAPVNARGRRRFHTIWSAVWAVGFHKIEST